MRVYGLSPSKISPVINEATSKATIFSNFNIAFVKDPDLIKVWKRWSNFFSKHFVFFAKIIVHLSFLEKRLVVFSFVWYPITDLLSKAIKLRKKCKMFHANTVGNYFELLVSLGVLLQLMASQNSSDFSTLICM